jgi:hypothetical protein
LGLWKGLPTHRRETRSRHLSFARESLHQTIGAMHVTCTLGLVGETHAYTVQALGSALSHLLDRQARWARGRCVRTRRRALC